MGNNYLLLGPETGEKTEFIQGIVGKLGEDIENYKFYPFDDFEQPLAEALSNASLFCPTRFVWLDIPQEYSANQSRPNFLKKDLEALVVSYLKNPDDDVTFVLSLAETGINKSIDEFFPATQNRNIKKVYWEMKDTEKPGWVRNFFRKQGIRIEDDAVTRILMLVENDTGELKTICSQLSGFFKMRDSNFISDDDIETYISHTRQEDGYSLFSYVASCDLEAALRCMDSILRTTTDQMVGVFGSLVWCFRRLNSVLTQIEAGSDQYRAFQAACVLDRPSKISRPNDLVVYKQACLNYTAAETEKIITLLASEEIAIRENGQDQIRLRAHMMLFDIIINKGSKPGPLRFPGF